MNKKGLLFGIGLIITSLLVGFFYYNLSTVKKYFNKTFGINQEISYEYNYTFSGFIDENGKKQKIDGLIDMGIFAKDKGLKERLIIKNFKMSFSGGSGSDIMFIKGLDIIEDEYKKYIKIDDMYSIENGKKEGINESFDGFKTGTYYLLDDTVFKNNLGKIYNQELLRIFLRSLLTSNPAYYLRKNKFGEKLKASLFSQKLAQKLFSKVGDSYVLTDKICFDDLKCKKFVKKFNDNFAVIWKKDSLIIQPKGLAAAIGKVQIDYKNKILDKISLNVASMGEVILDEDGFKNIDINFIGKKGEKFIVSYERGKKPLIIDLYLKLPDETIIKGNYENGKGEFSIIDERQGKTLNIEVNDNVCSFMFSDKFSNENINGKLDFNKGIYTVLTNVKGVKILDFSLNTKTYEGNFNLHIPDIVNIDISSKKEKESILLKGNGDIVQKNYYGEIKHSFNLDFKINKKETIGNLVVDNTKLDVNAKYGKKYDIKVSALLGDNKGNLNIKGEGFKGKIVLNVNDKQMLFGTYDIGNYDYYTGFDKLNINLHLDKLGNDSLEFKLFLKKIKEKDIGKLYIKNGENVINFEVKGYIKKGAVTYKIPKKFEILPEKAQAYVLLGFLFANYNFALPNFDYKVLIENMKSPYFLLLQNWTYLVSIIFFGVTYDDLFSNSSFNTNSIFKKTKEKYIVLLSVNSTAKDLKSIGVCNDPNGKIMYDALTGIYGMKCKNVSEEQKDIIRSISLIKEEDCSKSDILSGVANICYKVK